MPFLAAFGFIAKSLVSNWPDWVVVFVCFCVLCWMHFEVSCFVYLRSILSSSMLGICKECFTWWLTLRSWLFTTIYFKLVSCAESDSGTSWHGRRLRCGGSGQDFTINLSTRSLHWNGHNQEITMITWSSHRYTGDWFRGAGLMRWKCVDCEWLRLAQGKPMPKLSLNLDEHFEQVWTYCVVSSMFFRV